MFRRLISGLLVAMAVAACSDPPVKEQHQAEGAIEAAKAAGAPTYAPAELKDAEDALNKYGDAVAQRDFRLALNDALEARDRAYDAAKQAANKKAELRSQAERSVAQLEALMKTAATHLTLSGPRPTAERLRTASQSAGTALQEARTALAKEDYAGASATLLPAIAALTRELPAPEPQPAKRKK